MIGYGKILVLFHLVNHKMEGTSIYGNGFIALEAYHMMPMVMPLHLVAGFSVLKNDLVQDTL